MSQRCNRIKLELLYRLTIFRFLLNEFVPNERSTFPFRRIFYFKNDFVLSTLLKRFPVNGLWAAVDAVGVQFHKKVGISFNFETRTRNLHRNRGQTRLNSIRVNAHEDWRHFPGATWRSHRQFQSEGIRNSRNIKWLWRSTNLQLQFIKKCLN